MTDVDVEKAEFKQNDLLPTFLGRCSDARGPVDMRSASKIYFIMRIKGQDNSTGQPKVVGEAHPYEGEEVDNTDGSWIEYEWVVGDLSMSGEFFVEIQGMWGSKPRTFPTNGFSQLIVHADLGGTTP